jgi:hypothetical protein
MEVLRDAGPPCVRVDALAERSLKDGLGVFPSGATGGFEESL